jgi:predicted nucleic acid-binding protein
VSVFLDTSALYAGLDKDDANHQAAKGTWRRLLTATDRLITINYVIVETVALVQTRLGMAAVREVVADLVPVLDVEWVGPEDHAAASSALLAAGRRGLSLVDCVSFQVMRRLGVKRAFAFDRHFTEQGFELVR